MGLQKQIKKILKEEYNDRQKKLLTLTSQIGFLSTSNLVGGVKELLNILGEDFLSNNNMIKIIKEIVVTTDGGYLKFSDFNQDPIILNYKGNKLSRIEIIYPEDVAVFHYSKYIWSQSLIDDGETYELYESLPRDILIDLFDIVLRIYIDYISSW